MTIAQQRFNAIKDFVNYKIDNKPSTRAKIKRHYEKLVPHLGRPFGVFKSKSKSRIKAAAKTGGFGRLGASLKAVPLDNAGNIAGLKITWKKGGLNYETPHLETRSLKFNKAKFKSASRKARKYIKKDSDAAAAIMRDFLQSEMKPIDPKAIVQIDTRGFMLKSESDKDLAIEEILRIWGTYTEKKEKPENFIDGVRYGQLKKQKKKAARIKKKKPGKNRGKKILGYRR